MYPRWGEEVRVYSRPQRGRVRVGVCLQLAGRRDGRAPYWLSRTAIPAPSPHPPAPAPLPHGRGAGEEDRRAPYCWSRTAIPAPLPASPRWGEETRVWPPLGGGEKRVSPLGGGEKRVSPLGGGGEGELLPPMGAVGV